MSQTTLKSEITLESLWRLYKPIRKKGVSAFSILDGNTLQTMFSIDRHFDVLEDGYTYEHVVLLHDRIIQFDKQLKIEINQKVMKILKFGGIVVVAFLILLLLIL